MDLNRKNAYGRWLAVRADDLDRARMLRLAGKKDEARKQIQRMKR